MPATAEGSAAGRRGRSAAGDDGVEIPAELLSFSDREESWAGWLAALPRLVRDIFGEWRLTLDGRPRNGFCALVVPALAEDGRRTVVKFAWPHDEEEHEHLMLQAIHGDGLVELYRADPRRHVMLLERLDAERDLRSVGDLEACEITASMYDRIHIPALPQLRTLTSYIERWTDDLRVLPRAAPIPRRLVEQAISLGHGFVHDPQSVGRCIHGDLHYENVLAAEREPWLIIDPKPMSGDPHYEVAPMLWNRWDEVVASGDVRGSLRRRFQAIVDTAGLDEDRARDWVIVRMVHNAMWVVEDSAEGFDDESREYLTSCIAIAKAVQD
jgi:streptomycin 6-kinase